MKVLVLAALALCSAAAPALAQIPAHGLPAEIRYPEGVAYDPASNAMFTANAADGTVVRIDRRTGSAVILAKPGRLAPAGEAPFPAILGMKIDPQARLWLAGGRQGKMFVLDTRTGALLKTFATNDPASLINDVVLTGEAAYFTDTFVPTLWRAAVSGEQLGELEPWLDLKAAGLEWFEGANLNGIAATADGATLIVVQMNAGRLYRIDVATKTAAYIDLGGELVEGGDGLVLDGRTLYVVRQPQAEVVTIDLAADLSSGRIVNRFRDPALAWPATAAKAGESLLVVNSQFDARSTDDPLRRFNILAIPTSRLAPPSAVTTAPVQPAAD